MYFTGGSNLQIIVKACKVLLKFVLLDLERKRESQQPLKVLWSYVQSVANLYWVSRGDCRSRHYYCLTCWTWSELVYWGCWCIWLDYLPDKNPSKHTVNILRRLVLANSKYIPGKWVNISWLTAWIGNMLSPHFFQRIFVKRKKLQADIRH